MSSSCPSSDTTCTKSGEIAAQLAHHVVSTNGGDEELLTWGGSTVNPETCNVDFFFQKVNPKKAPAHCVRMQSLTEFFMLRLGKSAEQICKHF